MDNEISFWRKYYYTNVHCFRSFPSAIIRFKIHINYVIMNFVLCDCNITCNTNFWSAIHLLIYFDLSWTKYFTCDQTDELKQAQCRSVTKSFFHPRLNFALKWVNETMQKIPSHCCYKPLVPTIKLLIVGHCLSKHIFAHLYGIYLSHACMLC